MATPRQQEQRGDLDHITRGARECGFDPLLDNDDLAPARPVVWLAAAWLAVITVFALLFFAYPAGAHATTPIKKTVPVGDATPGAAPPAVISSPAATATSNNNVASSSTANAGSASSSQAGAFTGPVTAGNALTVDARLAQAPDVIAYPTAPCRVSIGASGGWIGGALGFSGSTEDEGCTLRETSRQLWNIGQRDAAVQILCLNADAKAALQAAGVACRIERVTQERVTP